MAASASGGRDWYAALPLPWRIDSLDYVLRSIGAAALALGLGLYLQLDSPFSAASTVLLLINPVQGAVVGKGWWRAVGTLVGTLAAFVLTALFAQKMLLFVVALGFWLGLCVGVMSLVRHFYATAAVVAGYTVCLALGSAMVEPEAAFEHIVTRASAVIVGVCCLSLVTVLFSRRTVSGRVRQRLVSLCAATLALVAARHAGAADGELERRRRTLAGEVYAVDDLLGVGRAESRALSAALPAIRGGLAALFSTLMEFRFAGETHWARRLAERGLALPMADDLRLLGGQLERGELDFAGAARRLASLRGRLAAIRRGLPTDQADACREGLFMERLDEQLDDLQAALRGFARLDGRARADVRPAAFHRHYREALRNGARAWLAMLVGGALWFLSGWDQGPTLLAVLGPYCTLLAASPFPAEGTRNFIRGTLYAIPAALLCKFLLLPLINGFPLLLLCLAFFWSFGIQATTVPGRALQGIAYLIAFNTLVATGNLARFDFGDFANQSCAGCWRSASACWSTACCRRTWNGIRRRCSTICAARPSPCCVVVPVSTRMPGRPASSIASPNWARCMAWNIRAARWPCASASYPCNSTASRGACGAPWPGSTRPPRRRGGSSAHCEPSPSAIAIRRSPRGTHAVPAPAWRPPASGAWPRSSPTSPGCSGPIRKASRPTGRSMEKRPHENLVLAGLAAVLLVPGPGGGRRRERVAADRALRLRHAAGHRAGAFRHAGAGHLWRGAAGDALPRQRRTPTSLAVPRPWRGLFAALRSGRRRCLSAPRLR